MADGSGKMLKPCNLERVTAAATSDAYAASRVIGTRQDEDIHTSS